MCVEVYAPSLYPIAKSEATDRDVNGIVTQDRLS